MVEQSRLVSETGVVNEVGAVRKVAEKLDGFRPEYVVHDADGAMLKLGAPLGVNRTLIEAGNSVQLMALTGDDEGSDAAAQHGAHAHDAGAPIDKTAPRS
ncbi:hypothetical protein BWQ96_00962 [Gracilariopsis chorda]|uniref:Uncharacterized protein n=1 Tax=Gracilariopsis chorda TaxID=448386 RepID=A0A2V3J4D8_9FLOR|nr:hypothetical protein BWQ96_00962 [Gracilariopsis chorda]|eukprot:PXF49173.1 hypothetical protein BWQ96_00962 [Gracilariopsis chorda]